MTALTRVSSPSLFVGHTYTEFDSIQKLCHFLPASVCGGEIVFTGRKEEQKSSLVIYDKIKIYFSKSID